MLAHTPGPFVSVENTPHSFDIMAAKLGVDPEATEDGRVIACVGYAEIPIDAPEREWIEAEVKANADLFSAAPDMLSILMMLGKGESVNLCCVNRTITKALGGARA